MQWIDNPTLPTPAALIRAFNYCQRHVLIQRYRSRTSVTDEHIQTAFTWMKLSKIVNDTLIASNTGPILYKTIAVPRGNVTETEAVDQIQELIQNIVSNRYTYNIVMINTATAAQNSTAVKQLFEEYPDWQKLDVETMIISTNNHKVSVFKYETTYNTTYVVLNNVDTPTVLFKIAAAIMLDAKALEEYTETLAQAWITGQSDVIFRAINAYYEDYEAKEKRKNREEAIQHLCTAMIRDREDEFKKKMNVAQENIEGLFARIEEATEKLNRIKGEYLLYRLEDNSKKNEELCKFFESCKDKLMYVKFNDNYLSFVYSTDLIYFEEDLLNRYFESTRTNSVNGAPKAYQQLLKDIFINKTYVLRIESGARFNINTGDIRFTNPRDVLNTAVEGMCGIPNPHHLYYNCWGDYTSHVYRAVQEKDYIKVIMQLCAAIAGINIADTAVIDRFVREELRNYENTPCLRNKETGEIITIKEYERRYSLNAPDETDE